VSPGRNPYNQSTPSGGSGVPLAVYHTEVERHIFQAPLEGSREVRCLRAIRSGDGDLLVPLVPQGQGVLVETLSIQFPVVLQGGNGVQSC